MFNGGDDGWEECWFDFCCWLGVIVEFGKVVMGVVEEEGRFGFGVCWIWGC